MDKVSTGGDGHPIREGGTRVLNIHRQGGNKKAYAIGAWGGQTN